MTWGRARATVIGICCAIFSVAGAAGAAAAFTATLGFTATTYATAIGAAPAGLAALGGALYVVDPADGGLYRSMGGPATRVATLGGGPTGLVVAGGQLYVTLSTAHQVVRIDPTTFARTTVATVPGDPPTGIAADPTTGDLYVAAGAFLWRIGTPAASPSLSLYPGGTQLPGPPTGLYGIAVANDWIYVINTADGHVWRLETPARAGAGLPTPLTITTVASARGIAVILGYAFITASDGSITRFPIPDQTTGSASFALTGGAGGDLATIGGDGCFYASQGLAVTRLADATGGCDLAHAGPPPPPVALTLANTSSVAPLIGFDQTFDATLSNAATLSGVPVTFTVTRGTVTVRSTTTTATAPNGVASFGYHATTPGTDVVLATAVVNGATVTSNAVTVVWPRPLDTSPPHIAYTVTAASNGANFACPDTSRGTPGSFEYCGWYTAPPTIHWSFAATGPSGLAPGQSCPDFTLTVSSPITGTPGTCTVVNGDGFAAPFTVVLNSLIVAPSITASAGSYIAGTPTNQSVTVTFSCASDPALGPGAIVDCTGPQTISAEGTTTVTGRVLDVAGMSRTVPFGPIVIDKTPPVVIVSGMTTADGHAYVAGTPTTQDVLVSFSCSDTVAMSPTGCPSPTVVAAGPTVTVSATDVAGNTGTYTFGGINIDRAGPTVTAAITPPPDANGNNAFTATVDLAAADPSGVASITYSASGAQPIGATTVGGATAQVSLHTVGVTTVRYNATDALGNVGPTGTVIVRIVSTQPSTLQIVSAPFQIAGTAAIQVALTGPGGTPVTGRAVTITGAGAPQTVTTAADGTARLAVALAPGGYTIGASFAGDPQWYPSVAAAQTLILAGATQFVIWGGNPGGVQAGQRVVFWGEHWWDGVSLPEKAKVKDFKGWAATVSGALWSTKPGDSKPPRTVPAYISVIVTTSIERTNGHGDRISGNIVGHAILRVDSTHRDEPSKPVSGVVVAVLP